jgi:tripartite-type tricarboxylate transporter receptor subunit TctC
MTSRRTFVAATASLLATVPRFARAGDYPNKPIRMVVPYAAGGSADVLGRPIAEAMGKTLHQPIVVDLRPGAGGNLGAEVVARSAPGDGYTVLFASLSLSTSLSFTKLNFDPRKDLIPVAGVGTLPSLLLVAANSKHKTLQDVINAAKAGEQVSFASAGYTTGSHLFGELLRAEAGIQATHVPFRGSGAAYPDLISGRISMMFDVMGSALPQVNGGLVRAIAITSNQRAKSLPEVPTLAELGFQGFDVGTWFGLFAPAGTPEEALTRLEGAALQAVKTPEVSRQLASVLADPIPGPGNEFKRWYLADVDRWARLAKDGKITISDK